MKLRNKLMILAVVAMAAVQTACVEPGHNYPDDGLPLGGTVWQAKWNSQSPNGGPMSEEWTLAFEVGSTVRRHYKVVDDRETATDEKIGSYEYKSPEGRFSLDGSVSKFLVKGREMYIDGSPVTYFCIQGRD